MATPPRRQAKAQTQYLVKSEDGTGARKMSYLCSKHSIKECFKPEFFNNIASNFLPGDEVRCIQITNTRCPEDAIVSASWTGIVLKLHKRDRGKEEVIFVPVDDNGITYYKLPTLEELKVEKPVIPTNWIQGDGTVEHNVSSGTYTVMEGGKEICTVDDKQEAHAIARGDKEIPEVTLF